MARCVLVTRGEPGASETMRWVTSLGWHAVACPMLRIALYPPLPLLDVDAVAVTSANALPALSGQPRDLRIVAVGARTADRARQAGFLNVEAAEGNAVSLAALCRAGGLKGPRLLLACGRGYGMDWAHEMGCARREVYGVSPEPTLSADALEALRQERVEAVSFYSGETAAAFMAACSHDLRDVRAVCLSEAIAARLPRERWKSVGLLENLGCSSGLRARTNMRGDI